jgi:hypothetical protein
VRTVGSGVWLWWLRWESSKCCSYRLRRCYVDGNSVLAGIAVSRHSSCFQQVKFSIRLCVSFGVSVCCQHERDLHQAGVCREEGNTGDVPQALYGRRVPKALRNEVLITDLIQRRRCWYKVYHDLASRGTVRSGMFRGFRLAVHFVSNSE